MENSVFAEFIADGSRVSRIPLPYDMNLSEFRVRVSSLALDLWKNLNALKSFTVLVDNAEVVSFTR